MIISSIIVFAVHVLVPLLFIVALWRGGYESKLSWLVTVLGYGGYIVYIFLFGAGWGWVSYYARLAVLVAFLCAVYVSFRRTFRAGVPGWRRPGSLGGWASLSVNAFLVVFFAGSTVVAAQGFGYGELRAAQLSFPLGDGVWHVAHGGDSVALNYHNPDRAQRFALDIDKLNPAGTRASGLFPSDPERYAAFGNEILSPCAGEVVVAKDGQVDHRGSGTDRKNPAGNHVVIRCEGVDPGVDVVLAHMKQGTVAVERGESVDRGQLLGMVGNSGNTSEPHLHVHAVRTGSGNALEGEGMPIEFDGRFLVRNDLVFER